MRLEVTPARALMDEALQIRIRDAEPGCLAGLRARMEGGGELWESVTTFRADAEGRIDVHADEPVDGPYTGVDPMGPIWSMRLTQAQGTQATGHETEPAPTAVVPGAPAMLVTFTVELDGAVCATATAERLRVADDVRRTEVRDRGLVGTLFEPMGAGPHPAILIVGGSEGGLYEDTAAMLASRGYVALALAYFAFPGLEPGIDRIPLEYFGTAIELLGARANVHADRIAITGGSRGGELALLAGATFPELRAVIAYAPSSVIWEGYATDPHDGETVPAWTWQGRPMNALRWDDDAAASVWRPPADASEAIAMTPLFLAMLQDEAAVEAATIPVENTRADILLVSGADDRMWPSSQFSGRILERLRSRGYRGNVETLDYPEAGHEIAIPYVPTTVTDTLHPQDGIRYALGGTPAANAHASADSWRRVLAFLERAMRR